MSGSAGSNFLNLSSLAVPWDWKGNAGASTQSPEGRPPGPNAEVKASEVRVDGQGEQQNVFLVTHSDRLLRVKVGPSHLCDIAT